MANNPRMAPWPITATAGTDGGGKPSASATIGAVTYTCTGDTAKLALLALAQRLVAEGADPLCSLTQDGISIADIISAV
jgi:hypothetical protein